MSAVLGLALVGCGDTVSPSAFLAATPSPLVAQSGRCGSAEFIIDSSLDGHYVQVPLHARLEVRLAVDPTLVKTSVLAPDAASAPSPPATADQCWTAVGTGDTNLADHGSPTRSPAQVPVRVTQ